MNKPSRGALSLHAFVSRGPKAGTLLYPHQHKDDTYVVSMTRFEKDYVHLTDLDGVLDWLEKGFRLRMSNKQGGVPAPSLIEPGAIYRPVRL